MNQIEFIVRAKVEKKRRVLRKTNRESVQEYKERVYTIVLDLFMDSTFELDMYVLMDDDTMPFDEERDMVIQDIFQEILEENNIL